jgi:hypothetical protein
MTPQERELIADLFDRLAQLEDQPRDPEAERAIAEGLRRAPHAVYPLVQTVLVQDEALKVANARIEELEGDGREAGGRPGGFLDNMRDALFGRSDPQRSDPQRGSVPSVRPGVQSGVAAAPSSAPQGPFGQPYPQGPFGQPYSQGPSFLGTAAAAAAGMVGGALLLDGVRSMLGGHHHGPFAQTFGELNAGPRSDEGSPWQGGGSDQLSHQAGLDDIGRASEHGNEGGAPQGFTETDYEEADDGGDTDVADDGGFDDGSDDGMDTA